MTNRRWVRVCSLRQLETGRGVAALVGGEQIALFLLPGAGGEPAARLRAVDNRDPVSGANVLARGILGSTGDADYVASPMHKHRFDLTSGRCLDGRSPGVRVWPVRVWGATVEVLAVGGDDAVAAPTTTATHCPYCALQCGMHLQVAQAHPDGDPPTCEVPADPSFPVNQGRMCVKGWTSVELLTHPDRLLQPQVRDRSGRLKAATWDALDELAARLERVRADHGPDAVGVFGSGALTNEKAYLLGKFARVALATANIDYNGRYCMSSAAAGQNRAFGIDRGMPFPLADVADADTVMLWGSNPADTMPPLMPWLERQRDAGGTLIVVDPRRSATAQVADLHIQPVPGTDLVVAVGMLHLAVAGGMIDQRYIDERTIGWSSVRDSVADWSPDRVERTSGVSEAELRQAVRALAEPASILLSGRGPEQQSKGVDTVSALINLMLALGKVGQAASGYGCLTGQGNGQGGREHGQKADQLPGYRLIGDDADRAAIAAVWGVDPAELPGPGRSAVEMLDSIGADDGLRAMVVVGSNVAVASPDARRVTEQLGQLDCLAVLDAFPNHTTDLAHVILPVTQWAEENGTTTNLEGRVLRRRQATIPPPGVRSDIDVLCALAARLGHGERFAFDNAEHVFAELGQASAGGRADYAGITYQRLDEGPGVFWPCPATDDPGTPRLFAERFAHPDGRARFVAVGHRPAAEEPDVDYPVFFTTGRYREHYNSGSQTRRVRRLQEAQPEPRLQIHPDLATSLGITGEGDVIVESRRGTVTFRADITTDIRADTVFAPFHWGGRRAANQLTVAALDPISGMPEFKLCAVRIRPAP